MSNLEAYILKKYGEWVPFDICSAELGFDIQEAVALTIKKSGNIMLSENEVAWQKPKKTKYVYQVPVMSSTVVRGDTLLFTELAKLLNLNMHNGGKK
ncbi:MAG: hypothetical protein B7Y23_02810 [Sulfurovum sp. 16-42-52]|nr:MAG: hypothetical protein B7Y23_02810 [Sulfurovum sp. 16-42-52]OZA46175.1 MAG: hypothetical protein B7X80_03240 [Sulfurovum sp. 17-42-90]